MELEAGCDYDVCGGEVCLGENGPLLSISVLPTTAF